MNITPNPDTAAQITVDLPLEAIQTDEPGSAEIGIPAGEPSDLDAQSQTIAEPAAQNPAAQPEAQPEPEATIELTPQEIEDRNLAAEKPFLAACLSFESDEVSLVNATKIRDIALQLETILRDGLDANRPFSIEGLQETTPLGFAASQLSDLAFRSHELMGKSANDVPSMAQEQSLKSARRALRGVVKAALDANPQLLRTTSEPAGDEFQSLYGLCAVDDAELIEQCIQAGIPLTSSFVECVSYDILNELDLKNGAFSAALKQALSDPSLQEAMTAALNRPQDLIKTSETNFKTLSEQLRGAITQTTIDEALLTSVNQTAKVEAVQGLLNLGANALGQPFAADEPTLLWRAMKDSHGIAAAKVLLEHTPDMNEKHAGVSLLARACQRRDDALIKLLADKGAKFITPQEAQVALIDAAERAGVTTIAIALDQGADVNGLDTEGVVRTALISAGLHDQAASVSLLLERGADPYLKVTKYKMIEGDYRQITTDFMDESLRIDAAKALHAAAEKLGVTVMNALNPSHQLIGKSPNCQKLLAAIKALDAIPKMEASLSNKVQEKLLNAGVDAAAVDNVMGVMKTVGMGDDEMGSMLHEMQSCEDETDLPKENSTRTDELGDFLNKLQKSGTQIIGVGPGGMNVNLSVGSGSKLPSKMRL